MMKTCKLSVIVYMFLLLAASVSACEKEGTWDTTRGVITDADEKDTTDQEGWKRTDSGYWLELGYPGSVTEDIIWQCDVLECEVCPTRSPDTAREYMVVDTVLTCPDCWTLKIHDTLYPYGIPARDAERWCFRDKNDPGWQEVAHPDTVIDITWLSKVQVWMDSTEYEDYLEWLEGDTLVWPSIGHIIDALDGIVERHKPPGWRDTVVDILE